MISIRFPLLEKQERNVVLKLVTELASNNPGIIY